METVLILPPFGSRPGDPDKKRQRQYDGKQCNDHDCTFTFAILGLPASPGTGSLGGNAQKGGGHDHRNFGIEQ